MASLDKWIVFFSRPYEVSYHPESFKTLKAAKKFIKAEEKRGHPIMAAYKRICLKGKKGERRS